MPKIAIIANTKSRGNAGWVSCRDMVHGRKNVEVYTLGESPLETLIQDAWRNGCQTIVAAGGDGTISSVADALVRLHIPARLGVLPIGTFNHFAKDLHIPLEIDDAMDVIENGQTIEIDIAKVNDRYFINNSSIGLYPHMVQARLGLEDNGINTWIASLYILISTCIKPRPFVVYFGKETDTLKKETSSIFIGNNKYTFEGFDIGARAKLDEGVLFVAILKSLDALGMLRLLYKVFRGTALESNDLNVTGLQECTINSTKKRILVSYDGEVVTMTPPLHYTIVPRALKVIVPSV